MIEPGRITRVDYRKFTWSGYINYQTTRKQFAGMENIGQRINKYLEHRINYTIEIQDRRFILEFKKLDDAKMFMLSFNDIIDTYGIKYE